MVEPVQRLEGGPALDEVLSPYLEQRRAPVGDRPWVLANMVAGLDGSAAVSGRVGELSDELDRTLFRALRAIPDAVLVGAETVRAERYGPARLTDELVAWRRAAGRPATPPIAVVSRSLRLDRTVPLFQHDDPRPIILTGASSPAAERASLEEVADVVVAGDVGVDLAAGLGALRERGADVVLCEGGPALLGQLVEARMLDELCLTLAGVMGGDALPVAVSPASSALARFELQHVLRSGSTLFLRYLREPTDA